MALTATQSTNLATNLLNTVAPFEMSDGQIKKSIAILKRWIARNVSGQGKLLFEATDDDLAQVVKNSLSRVGDKAKVVSTGVLQVLKTGGIAEWSKRLVIPFVGGETQLQGGVSAPARLASDIGTGDPDMPDILETATADDKPIPTDPADADKGRDKSGRKAGSRTTPKNPLTASEQHLARRLGVQVSAKTTFDDILNAAYKKAESITGPAKRRLAIQELGEVAALRDAPGEGELGRLSKVVEDWEEDTRKTTPRAQRDRRAGIESKKQIKGGLLKKLREGGELPPIMQKRLQKLLGGGKGGEFLGEKFSAGALKDVVGTQKGVQAAAGISEGTGSFGKFLSELKKKATISGKGSMAKGLGKSAGKAGLYSLLPLLLYEMYGKASQYKTGKRESAIRELAPPRSVDQRVQDNINQQAQMSEALGTGGPDPRILEMIQNFGREGLSRSQTRIGPNPLMAGLQSGKLSMQDIMALLQQQGA